MSVSDKKKLFESAMEEHLKPSPKPGENTFPLSFTNKMYVTLIDVKKFV